MFFVPHLPVPPSEATRVFANSSSSGLKGGMGGGGDGGDGGMGGGEGGDGGGGECGGGECGGVVGDGGDGEGGGGDGDGGDGVISGRIPNPAACPKSKSKNEKKTRICVRDGFRVNSMLTGACPLRSQGRVCDACV